ncbi:MAG: TetR/AcrR family transcriptional regulator [Pseudomonadota bacterium]
METPDGEETEEPSARTRLLDAARAEFFEHGYSAVTTDRLAQAARMSKATMYRHYPTKQSLFAAVLNRETQRFAAGGPAHASSRAEFLASLAIFGRNFLRLITDPQVQRFGRTMLRYAETYPESAELFHAHALRKTRRDLGAIIGEAAAKGFARTDMPPERLAGHLLSLWQGVEHAAAQLGRTEEGGRDIETRVREGIEILFPG